MDNDILITNESNIDGRKSLSKQISDIVNARQEVQKQNSILNANLKELAGNNATKNLEKNLDILNSLVQEVNKNVSANLKAQDAQIKASADATKALITQTNINKEAKRAFEAFQKTQKDYNKALEEGITAEKAFELESAFSELREEIPSLIKIFTNLKNNVNNCTDSVKAQTQAMVNNTKNRIDETKARINVRKQEYQVNKNTGDQSLPKAIKTELSSFKSTIIDLKNTFNLQKLADTVATFAPTARQKLQGDLQTNFNLSGSEFESFKRDLYGQIDTSLYTNEAIKNAMNTLNTTALGSTKTATAYFADILKGQQLLGISMQTQQELLKLGNITGRNELAFYQNQVAKFLNSNLGLNKQQLDELVAMNAALSTQAADLGIATEAFEKTSLLESAAFEKTNTGSGRIYTQALSSLLANTNTTSALLGLSGGDLNERLARGDSLINLLENGIGSKTILDVLRSGNIKNIDAYREYAASALGVDNNTWSLLRVMATQNGELNRNLATATEASIEDAKKVMESLENKQYDSISNIQKTVTDIYNKLEENIDWKILNMVTNIGNLLVTLISAVEISSNLKEFASLIGKGPTKGGMVSHLIGKTGAAITKFGGGHASTGLLKLGGIGLGLAGAGLGISDALSMYSSSGNQIDLLRGFFMGTAHSGQSAEGNTMSVMGNTAKGALIGTAFGGLPGTVIGGIIGAGLGIIGSLLEKGDNSEERRAKEQQKILEDIKKNTYQTALNTVKDGIGIVYRYRGYSNFSTGSTSTGMGDIAGGNYGISSYYGPREPVRTKDGKITSSYHSGIDFPAPEGTPLYSNVTGTVAGLGKDSEGANYVGVTDSNTGYTHWYWHMNKPALVKRGAHVNKGDLVGYVGQTGLASGPHLHYMVTKPGKSWGNAIDTVNPYSFATSSIFEGTTSSSTNLVDVAKMPTSLITNKPTLLAANHIGSVAEPIVNSISDLKQTIIDLSAKTSRNEKIMNALLNRTIESPRV